MESTLKVRQSNMEFLRIIAMFMVMMLHVNNAALGLPSVEDARLNGLPTFFRIIFETLSIGSVNIFVLISGWFGIKNSWKSLSSFIFQCVFITWGISIVLICLRLVPLTFSKIDAILFVRSWFIQAYLGLYLLAPALNCLIKQSKRNHLQLLIGLFLLEFIYDFCAPSMPIFQSGYSTMHFILLYLLARYIKLYKSKDKIISFVKKWSFTLFLFSIIVLSIFQFLALTNGITFVFRLNVYSSPVIIFTSLCLLLTFSKLKFQNSIINSVAASSFAVYLVHTNPFILSKYFIKEATTIYNNFGGFKYLICIGTYMILWYALAFLIDLIRRFVQNKAMLKISKNR
ncbi:acyltransferase family protein [Bacteroides sp.]|uniref:acyltransferase family protein n=1 Tax=Bacteroides sp. TaxID=29523 RepID=UPI003A95D3A3